MDFDTWRKWFMKREPKEIKAFMAMHDELRLMYKEIASHVASRYDINEDVKYKKYKMHPYILPSGTTYIKFVYQQWNRQSIECAFAITNENQIYLIYKGWIYKGIKKIRTAATAHKCLLILKKEGKL